MANRLRSKVGLLSPFVSSQYVNKLAKRIQGLPWLPTNFMRAVPECTDQDNKKSNIDTERTHIKVTKSNWFKKDECVVDVGSIYKTLPNAKTAVNRQTPEPRFVWKECQPKEFPASPEDAKVDVMTYLEQKDCYSRLQKLQVPDFCVGSIIAVTRADSYVPKGKVRFVGICIAKNHWQNTLGATFTLRNVVDGEPMEVNFQLYSPNIQKIEVLKHERRDKPSLWYLRDYPPNNSYVNEAMEALPYTEEPSLYIKSKEERHKIEKWFEQVRKSKRRR